MNFDFQKMQAINVLNDDTLEATIESNIADTEAYLMNVCYEYGISYEGTYMDDYNYPLLLTEGILSSALSIIRRAVKAAVKFLVNLWKKLVSFVKACFRAIMKMFGFGGNKASFSSPVEFSLITLEGAYVSKQSAKDFKEMKKIAELNIKAISAEIKERSREQIEYTEQLNKLKPVKEGRELRGRDHSLFNQEVSDRMDAIAANNPALKQQIDAAAAADPYQDQMGGLHRDMIDTMRSGGTKYFALEKEKALLDSQNIVEEYNQWLNCEFKKMIGDGAAALGAPNLDEGRKMTGESAVNTGIIRAVAGSYYAMQSFGYSDEEIMAYIRGAMVDVPEDPEVVRTMIKLRINYNRHTCDLLERMLKLNFKVLGYSKEDAMELIKALRTQDAKAVEKIRSRLATNIGNYLSPGVLDLTPLGGAVMYFTKDDLGDIRSYVTSDDGAHFMNYFFRYDCILFAHGGTQKLRTDEQKEASEANSRARIRFFTFCKQMAQKYHVRLKTEDGETFDPSKHTFGDIEDIWYNDILPQLSIEEHSKCDALDKAWGEANRKANSYPNEGKETWICQPISVAGNSPCHDVNKCVKYAIEAGYKRILVVSCNPGHHRLDSKMIRRAKGVIVHYATSKLFA